MKENTHGIRTHTLGTSILTLLFIICFLLNSGYAFILVDDRLTLASLPICVIVTFFMWGIKKQYVYKRFYTNPLVILSVAIFVVMLVHFDFGAWGSYARQIFVLLTAVMFAMSVPYTVFARVFIRFMKLVTVVAIIVWVIINVLHITLSFPIITGNSDSYYNQYYCGFLVFVNTYSTMRLMGPFWEPGVYASMTVIALLLQPSLTDSPKETSRFTTIILVVGLLLSFSTAGYILMIAVLIMRAIQKCGRKFSPLISVCLFAVLLFVLLFAEDLILLLADWMPTVFGKMTSNSLSLTTRLNGPLVDLSIFIQEPLLGVGMSQYQALWPVVALQLGVESRTSTITYFLANYGIFGILYFVSLLKATLLQKNSTLLVRLFLLGILAAILTKEPQYVNLLTCTVIAYLLRGEFFTTGVWRESLEHRREI